ncbi:hypothetical protein L6R49_07955 [Myxococcota bacterium]|nr:hypothetical protein [Myxococcota bacterium]
MSHEDYPWRLRLHHKGYASVLVERRGRWIRFDPYEAPEGDDVSVLTWTEAERCRGVIEAIRAGGRPTVVATPPTRMWLSEKGAVDDCSPGGKVDKVKIDAIEYQPVPYATAPEAVMKAKAALLNPRLALSRLKGRAEQPKGNPLAVMLTLPDGGRLVHLNCSLHRRADPAWIDRAVALFGGADWLIVGVDYGEGEAVMEHVPRFNAKLVLIADLVNETRRDLGLPTFILTPIVDRLVEMKIAAHPFVREASFRFE